MNHRQLWEQRLTALRQYATREKQTRIPLKHIEYVQDTPIALGVWIGYVRRRHAAGLLPVEKEVEIEQVSTWEWGPFPPGPPPKSDRNAQILEMRRRGLSLQTIADQYGLSRQRIHQIVSKAN